MPNQNPNEHRRRQVRTAQRAYRARHQANTAALQNRVAELERTLERIGEAVVSFSDALVYSDVLTSYPDIADRLRDTVQTCLVLARDGSGEDESDRHVERSQQTPDLETERRQRQMAIPLLPSVLADRSHGIHVQYPLFPGSDGTTGNIEISTFIEQLRITNLHRGFRMLSDPSTPFSALKRPFRLLLSCVTRETITAFFHARLHARLNKSKPERFFEIPAFQLGGAGTHYPLLLPDPAQNAEQGANIQDFQAPPQEYGTLSAFSPEDQDELNGDWFDIHDLEGYLREREVCLMRSRDVNTDSSPGFSRGIKAEDLIYALVGKAICLGHSPGYRRSDVESAINSLSCAG
ncbi:hypothetical protein BJX99DRAFT_251958 [Aspergillus californicus]